MNTYFLLVFLQIKHFYVDFVNQSPEEVHYKGVFGHRIGIRHSLKQAILTLIILLFFTTPYLSAILAFVDFTTHYLFDWTKRNYGNQDINSKQFWIHLGFDQLAHQMIYLIIYIIVMTNA